MQVDCSRAAWLAVAQHAGVRELLGIDPAPPPAESLLVPRSLVRRAPLARDLDLGRRFDLVLAPDLGARRPDSAADVAETLARLGDLLLVGIAGPDDPGDHGWLRALQTWGYEPVEGLPSALRTDPTIAPWHRRGLFLLASTAVRARRGLAVVPVDRAVPTAPDEATWRPTLPGRADLGASPVVAVVIPAHDYAHFLPDAVASVAAQTWPHVQCILVDDGSTDDTAAVAAELVARHRKLDLRFVQQPNLGVAQARNHGVRTATAPLIMQLDADDRLERDAIAHLVAALRADPEADIAHCDAREFGAGDALLAASPNVTRARLRRGNCINYCALLRRDLFLRLGGYRDIRGGYDDWDLWLSAAEAGARFVHVPSALLRYRRHGGSLMDRERARTSILRAQVVWNHPGTFARRELRLAADVLAQGAGDDSQALGLRLRQGLDALLAGRVQQALRHVAGA